jgi:2-alkenal reductase
MNNKSSCLVMLVALMLVLVMGVAIGGGAGYLLLARQSRGAIPLTIAESAITAQPVSLTMPPNSSQAVMVAEQSASVQAVDKVLPSVVTVINQTSFGVSSGTGFFITDDGYLVTNNHVVDGAGELVVIYAKGGSATARLIGTAPEFDLAVLKIEGHVPAVAEWGDSSELPLGSQVIAIGSALGRYQNTVTGGMLSGFNRELGGLRGLLQTDAAINHGNSGGPLINLAGQVIGINTMVVQGGPSDAVGLGFAIPSNIARNVVKRLVEGGDVRPPFLGIQYEQLYPELATENKLAISEGAYVQAVVANSPAGTAGLQEGDVISKIDGRAINDRNPLVSVLFEHVAGDTITLEVWRNGAVIQAQLKLVGRE